MFYGDLLTSPGWQDHVEAARLQLLAAETRVAAVAAGLGGFLTDQLAALGGRFHVGPGYVTSARLERPTYFPLLVADAGFPWPLVDGPRGRAPSIPAGSIRAILVFAEHFTADGVRDTAAQLAQLNPLDRREIRANDPPPGPRDLLPHGCRAAAVYIGLAGDTIGREQAFDAMTRACPCSFDAVILRTSNGAAWRYFAPERSQVEFAEFMAMLICGIVTPPPAQAPEPPRVRPPADRLIPIGQPAWTGWDSAGVNVVNPSK